MVIADPSFWFKFFTHPWELLLHLWEGCPTWLSQQCPWPAPMMSSSSWNPSLVKNSVHPIIPASRITWEISWSWYSQTVENFKNSFINWCCVAYTMASLKPMQLDFILTWVHWIVEGLQASFIMRKECDLGFQCQVPHPPTLTFVQWPLTGPLLFLSCLSHTILIVPSTGRGFKCN